MCLSLSLQVVFFSSLFLLHFNRKGMVYVRVCVCCVSYTLHCTPCTSPRSAAYAHAWACDWNAIKKICLCLYLYLCMHHWITSLFLFLFFLYLIIEKKILRCYTGCWHIEHHQTNSAQFGPGRFGDYMCDSPWSLLESATQAMKSRQGDNVEFVLWTG